MLAHVLALCALSVASSDDARVSAALKRAESAISQLEQHCESAKAFAGNQTKVMALEDDLESAAAKSASGFHQRREELTAEFNEEEQKAEAAARHANSLNETGAMTAALDKADTALATLRNVSKKLQALDREQRQEVSKALHAVRDNATGFARKAARRAESLADKTTDPLYSLGDSAEDVADRLTDKRTDLGNCAQESLERVDDKLHDKAESIEEAASKSLREGADSVHDKVDHLRALVERAATRKAAFEAVQFASQNQGSSVSLVTLAMTAVAASACTALLLMRFRAASSMRTPLLAQ